MEMKPIEVTFSKNKVIIVRPGQIIDFVMDGIHVEVRGIDHDPFRDVGMQPAKNDLYVMLRSGETYTTRRDDGTVLHIQAVDWDAAVVKK